MNKELYVSSTPHETKVALVEDDQLAEVFFERDNEYTLAGSIYKGRVTRVLPGMQSAFVDIGLERDAFLYVSDFLELGDEEDSEEFGEIPAPRTTVNITQPPQNGGAQDAVAEPPVDEAAEFLAAVEGVAPVEGDDETEVGEIRLLLPSTRIPGKAPAAGGAVVAAEAVAEVATIVLSALHRGSRALARTNRSLKQRSLCRKSRPIRVRSHEQNRVTRGAERIVPTHGEKPAPVPISALLRDTRRLCCLENQSPSTAT